jgi:NAD(P)-dependent dehydrogenase (short-subunit alcohol dehydrogenase family)
MSEKYSAVVIGVGPESGLGAALAKHFALQGLHIFVVGRSHNKLQLIVDRIHQQGGTATAVVADATLEPDIKRLFAIVQEKPYPLTLAVYNVDSYISTPLLETTSETFTRLWQQNCFGAFLFGQQAIAVMKPRQQGTIIFTGATASLRAKPPFTGFAMAKAGVRSLAQGMAREFGPEGIHVVHTILDGVIDGDRARTQYPEYVAEKGADGLLQPSAIAETYWAIHQQHRSVWTHELDLRPFKEPF